MYVLLIALIYISKIVFSAIPRLSENKRKAWFIAVSFFFLFFLVAFRDSSVGTDIENYLEKFTLIRERSWGYVLTHFYTERVEIGFALLNKFLGLFTRQPQTIIVASAALFCAGSARFIYRYIDDALTAVMLFTCCGIYMYSFNITRQMIAVALLINAWGLLTEKRYKWSLALFAVSMLFHVMSFVFVLAYIFYALRHNKRAVTITVSVGAFLVLLHRPLLKLASLLTDKFSYLDNTKQRIHAGGIWGVWIIELCIVALYLAYYFLKDTPYWSRVQGRLPHRVSTISATTSLCIPMFTALYIVFSVMGTTFNNLDRFGVYFLPFCIPMFIDFGKRVAEQNKLLGRIYLYGLHVCFVLYFVLFATTLDHYRYAFMW